MPRYHYEYSIGEETDYFMVDHPMSMDRLNNLFELFTYAKSNPTKVTDSSESTIEGLEELELSEEDQEVKLTRIVQPPNVHFKGGGWFTAQSKAMKYQGKNKKLYEKLREERSKRKSRNVSVADIDKELNLKSKAVDGIISDKKWDNLTNEQKKIANEYGVRPSKHYVK